MLTNQTIHVLLALLGKFPVNIMHPDAEMEFPLLVQAKKELQQLLDENDLVDIPYEVDS